MLRARRPAPQVECRLVCHALSDHLLQVFTGFAMLARRGLVRLSHERGAVAASSEQHLRNSAGAQLRVLVNGAIRVHYDMHDALDIVEQNLERCDFYFKRSYSSEYARRFPAHRHKIHPFGLNYKVLPDFADRAAALRALRFAPGWKAKLLGLIDALDAGNRLRYGPRVRHLESLPDLELSPRALFLVTAYDPHREPGRSRQKVEEFVRVNETRAACIRLLRKELGGTFLGGFVHNAYTARAYPDLLAHDGELTRKKNYVALVRKFPICIATTGLHGSIGWKLAEYVALARAIVSEKLNFEVPGELREGTNFLQFATPEQCVQKAVRLMESRDERCRLMLSNARYYQSHLRPDALLLNTLLTVLPARESDQRLPRAA